MQMAVENLPITPISNLRLSQHYLSPNDAVSILFLYHVGIIWPSLVDSNSTNASFLTLRIHVVVVDRGKCFGPFLRPSPLMDGSICMYIQDITSKCSLQLKCIFGFTIPII